jgi:hypothetical protein
MVFPHETLRCTDSSTDWTDSALFALFFALNSPVKPPAKKKDQSKILPFGYWIHGGLIERFLMMM